MLHFARWKTAAILLVCLAGVLACIPNLLPRAAFPDWFPARQINLGLDLRGGSQLLLEVDVDSLRRQRLESVADQMERGPRRRAAADTAHRQGRRRRRGPNSAA